MSSIADNLERARRLHEAARDAGLTVSDFQKRAGEYAGYVGDWYQELHSMAEDAKKYPGLQLPPELDDVLLEFGRQETGAVAKTGRIQDLWKI